MNSGCILTALFVLPAAMLVESADASPPPEDYLVPFRPSVYDELRPLLYKKLLVTQGNYGRMVELVGDPRRGEFAVSVQCDEKPGADKQCSVTLTKALSNLGALLEDNLEKGSLEALEKIRVVRKDASIGPSTASAIRATWMKFLDNIRPRRPGGPVVLDGTRIEFFIGSPITKRRFGEVPDRSGESINTLIALGRSLAKYCETGESERARLSKEIEKDARQLTGR